MYTVIFSKRADKDITNIVKHVAAENPPAAKTLGSSLLDLALSLDSMPYRVGEPSRFEVRKAGRFAYFALKTGAGLFFQVPPAARSLLPGR